MRERTRVLLCYVTFFPCLYFALTEKAGSTLRQQTDPIFHDWLKILLLWIGARILIWLTFKVWEWDPLSYLPSFVLFGGWLTQTIRGLQYFLLHENAIPRKNP